MMLRVCLLLVCALLATGRAMPMREQLDNPFLDLVGGSSSKGCATCTLVVGILEQFALDNELSLTAAAAQWCSDISVDIKLVGPICDIFLNGFVEKIQNDFNQGLSPDQSCHSTIPACADYPTCGLFSIWPVPPHQVQERVGGQRTKKVHHSHQLVSKLIPMLWKHDLITSKMAAKDHALKVGKPSGAEHWLPVPIPDWDQDRYAANWTYRGSQYHGKDCNDGNGKIYPGRTVGSDGDASEDSNCNGVWGVDSTGTPYEHSLCNVESRGVLSIGDSATAHFSIPGNYFWPNEINSTTYAELVKTALSELDWPQCSWSTAHYENDNCPYSSLNITSLYMKMNERNLCMHRDFVNMGVNGESVKSIGPPGNIEAIPARYKTDGPSTVIFAMIGNDICGAKKLDDWTPVQTFHDDAVNAFQFLDQNLAPNSHVVSIGLVDGRVLYDSLHDKIHPIGVTYTAFYDWLNCLNISPCWSWMNSNQTIRDAGTAHAELLSAQYQVIINSTKFQNFDLAYYFPDYAAIIAKWVAAGGSAQDLIEPTDGFHPSQTGNILLAEYLWERIEQDIPDAMGPINPNNQQIQTLFGDQGGY